MEQHLNSESKAVFKDKIGLPYLLVLLMTVSGLLSPHFLSISKVPSPSVIWRIENIKRSASVTNLDVVVSAGSVSFHCEVCKGQDDSFARINKDGKGLVQVYGVGGGIVGRHEASTRGS